MIGAIGAVLGQGGDDVGHTTDDACLLLRELGSASVAALSTASRSECSMSRQSDAVFLRWRIRASVSAVVNNGWRTTMRIWCSGSTSAATRDRTKEVTSVVAALSLAHYL